MSIETLIEKEEKFCKENNIESLTSDQKKRLSIAYDTEASEFLEGYSPQSEVGGYAYELQKKWIIGEITIDERFSLLKKHHGLV